jgi:uncharacterized membrane protein
MSEASSAQPSVSEKKEPNIFQKVEMHLQRKTLAGLIQLVPLLVTVIVLLFIINHADSMIRPLAFVSGQPWDFTGIGLIAIIVIFYLVGLATSVRIGQRIMDFWEKVVSTVPVVKTIFGVTQQATAALTSQHNFSRVVFVEWPREGMAAMGFVTSRVHSADTGESMVLVYIPTVPNPTSGNLALVFEDDVMETDLTVENAMKLVFSGGIVLPEAVSLARVLQERVEPPKLIGRYEVDPS